jgi:lipoprotein-anchoring transpeptidase ErfK/SrfK
MAEGLLMRRSRYPRVLTFLMLFIQACATVQPDLPPVPVGNETENGKQENGKRDETAGVAQAVSIVAPAAGARSGSPDDVLRLQVMLDRANFSPGPIDGRWGPNTRAALRAWQRREGLLETGEIDDAVRARLPPIDSIFTSHIVEPEEHAALRPFPRDWRARAALDHHGYETILEGIAERYHATERFIREQNPDLLWPNPPPGSVVRVARVRPYERFRVARIEIRLAEKTLRAFDETGRLVAHFPCSIARRVEKRPVGELRIVNAASEPNYTFDPSLFADDPFAAGIDRRLLIPPGPNNPVGLAWLSLDRPGYGIHGTPAPEEIGKTESYGCFRLANWNARKLLDAISIGIPVIVHE